jgi:site-specific DNA-cytosine methylase
MRVLIACEYSGKVRDAFISKGHDVMSCDILDTEKPGPHYKGDVRDILYDGWDMLIGFPPCTHLASSGARWFKEKQSDGRQQEGIDFFMLLANSGIPKIALENPVGIMSSRYRKPDQIIQPWQFGHGETKSTCLWEVAAI